MLFFVGFRGVPKIAKNLVNDRNGISPEPDRNRNMDFLPNRNRTGTETHYRNISINIFSDLRICKEFLINILKTTADFL